MTSWQEFEALSALARREPAPSVDVRAAVLDALRETSGRRKRWTLPGQIAAAGLDPLAIAWLAASLVLAMVTIGLALPAADTFGQTFVTCVNPLSLMLQ